jgi:hypothetical protein
MQQEMCTMHLKSNKKLDLAQQETRLMQLEMCVHLIELDIF